MFKDYSLKRFYKPRNINQELKRIEKETGLDDPKKIRNEFENRRYIEAKGLAFADKFKQMANPWMECKECRKLIPNDWNLVQRHMMHFHIKDRRKYKEFGFPIVPVSRVRSVIV